jgi:lipopolysaccharide transport system ATP-binding protein
MAAIAEPEVAVAARGLRKEFRLGEHRSLQLTVGKLFGRQPGARGKFEALAGVDFTFRRGESYGVVGINGSGKSTLLQILAGTVLPSGGEMTVTGRVVPLLGVGMAFHPELTGRENVTLFAASLGIARETSEARMEDVAAFSELAQHLNTPIKRYSSGMVSRLSFAIAMQLPGDIYVFDEVLAVVDGEFQARCIEAIKDLERSGRTVIFVSHDLSLVRELCTQVLWLEKGEVRDHGAAGPVIDAYERFHAGHNE